MTDLVSSLEQARASEGRGDLAGARREAQAALAADPSNLPLLRYVGTLSCRMGELGDGAAYLRRALAIAPDDHSLRVDLAMALAAQGLAEEGLRVCAQAPATGNAAGLRRAEGQILQSLGRNEDAAAAYEGSLEAAPDDWESWNNLGGVKWAQGDVAGAAAAFRRAAALRPDMLPIQVNLGSVLAAAGVLDEALSAYQRALALAPGEPRLVITTARLLRQMTRHEEALDFLRNAPSDPDVQIERGRNLSALRRMREAEAAYRSALRAQRGFVEAFVELGIALERSGRVDELGPLLDQAAQQGVGGDSLAYLEALLLESQGRREEALQRAEHAPPGLEAVRVQRLISRLADREGQASRAFAAAAQANRFAAEDAPGAIERGAEFRAYVQALTDTATQAWLGQVAARASTGDRASPVFLVGFPRPGTTLLDTILMGHPALHVLEEVPLIERLLAEAGDIARLPDMDDAEAERLRSIYFADLDKEASPPPASTIIDKLPLNILGTPLIHRLFPDARFIFALRHPCDAALSCFMQGFEVNAAMANFLDIGTTAQLYDLVLTFWQRCREGLPLRVHELRYESLVEDAEASVRPLLEFLQLPWDDRVIDHQKSAAERGVIPTPSSNQVTQGLYGHARGRWTRYRDELAPVLPTLLPWAARLGYGDPEA